MAAAKDLGTPSTLLKTPGNLWNDNNNIDLFYLCPRGRRWRTIVPKRKLSHPKYTVTPSYVPNLGLFFTFVFFFYLQRIFTTSLELASQSYARSFFVLSKKVHRLNMSPFFFRSLSLKYSKRNGQKSISVEKQTPR